MQSLFWIELTLCLIYKGFLVSIFWNIYIELLEESVIKIGAIISLLKNNGEGIEDMKDVIRKIFEQNFKMNNNIWKFLELSEVVFKKDKFIDRMSIVHEVNKTQQQYKNIMSLVESTVLSHFFAELFKKLEEHSISILSSNPDSNTNSIHLISNK